MLRVLWALKASTGSLVFAQVLGSQYWYLTVEGNSWISIRLIWRGSPEPIIMRQEWSQTPSPAHPTHSLPFSEIRNAGRHRTRPGAGFSPQTPHSSGKKYRATFTMPAAFSHLLPAGSSPTPLGAQIRSRGWSHTATPTSPGRDTSDSASGAGWGSVPPGPGNRK